jgi:uncharacterized protein YbjT (DUF2867 family)
MATRVLVTGGSGVLGRHLVDRLYRADYVTRGSGRSQKPAQLPAVVEWAQADLETGAGVDEALRDVDVIIHAASSALRRSQQVDVDGTGALVERAKSAGVSHLIYISIVGIEHIPMTYYQHKLAAEQRIINGGVPWTILRATQFHDLLDRFIGTFTRLPIPIAFAPTDWKYQLVDSGEVADALCMCVAAGPRERVPDMGGPQVQTVRELMRSWLAARGLRRLVIPLPLPGAVAHAFRQGYNTCPQNRQGRITWEEWLRGKYRLIPTTPTHQKSA